MILFLGDSNSAGVAFPLKKQGYRIAHIEAGMRSYDKRMLEEINRTICDHCSDILFVYHDDYKKQLELENIKKNVFVVGNTIVEPVNLFSKQLFLIPKKNDMILMDIHRPENFNYEDRLKNIILFGNECYKKYNIPVKLLFFPRLKLSLEKYNINLANIEMIDLVPFKEYLEIVYHSKFLISDSGTGQEEPSLLNTPVIVPRDFTERVQSYDNNCSFQLKVNTGELNFTTVYEWLEQIFTNGLTINSQWLGDGNTSKLIVEKLVDYFK